MSSGSNKIELPEGHSRHSLSGTEYAAKSSLRSLITPHCKVSQCYITPSWRPSWPRPYTSNVILPWIDVTNIHDGCTGVWKTPEERHNGRNSSLRMLFQSCPVMSSTIEVQCSAFFACRLLIALPMFHRHHESHTVQ